MYPFGQLHFHDRDLHFMLLCCYWAHMEINFFYFLLCPSWGPLTPMEVTFSDDFPFLKPSPGSRSPHYAALGPILFPFIQLFLLGTKWTFVLVKEVETCLVCPVNKRGSEGAESFSSLPPASPERRSFPSMPFCILDSLLELKGNSHSSFISITPASQAAFISSRYATVSYHPVIIVPVI